MSKEKIYLELLTSCLGGGYEDIEKLVEYIEVASWLSNRPVVYVVEYLVEDVTAFGNKIEISSLFYSVMYYIFNHICDLLEKECPELEEKINDLRSSFNPHANYIASEFCNILDEIDLLSYAKSKDLGNLLLDIREMLEE